MPFASSPAEAPSVSTTLSARPITNTGGFTSLVIFAISLVFSVVYVITVCFAPLRTVDCTDHTLIQVPVVAGQASTGVDIGDWYEQSVVPLP